MVVQGKVCASAFTILPIDLFDCSAPLQEANCTFQDFPVRFTALKQRISVCMKRNYGSEACGD